ncbi:WAT1-related protein [Sesamum alatum]|uniref:WAT1-related protein n=1 Tax=Sesamum alatum TaxID=300844 RepID=A0AAE1Y7D4_9LAMI|nr:WAT1-related protein [Sesamum alatum]
MSWQDHITTLSMIACQFMYAAVILVGKKALSQDMSSMAFVVYRQFVAFLLLAPFVFTRRGPNACCMGWKNFWLIFLLSLVGSTLNMNLYFGGLNLASSTAASAMGNLVPAITFIMAYTIGLEKLNLPSARSVAKIIGTVLCVSGAVAIALLKGPKLLNDEIGEIRDTFLQGVHNQWLLGCLLLFGSACAWSLWLILQVPVSNSYPDHLSLTAWMCLMAAVQSGVLMLIVEPNMKAWKLNSSLQIFCCFFAGVASAATFFLQAWCIQRRGPLFSAMFQPLATVIVTLFACIFQHEELYLGSSIGSLAVIMGLYIVLWGKAKDVKGETSQTTLYTEVPDNESGTTDLKEPLLP